MTCIPRVSSALTIGASQGMPGLFTTSSELSTSSSLWPPSSKGMSHFLSVSAYSGLSLPLSERKTSKPFTLASTAEPTPLSPPPNIAILAMTI